MKKHGLFCFSLLCLFCAAFFFFTAVAQIPDLEPLNPVEYRIETEDSAIPLYTGPTVSYLLVADSTLDPSEPFVFFGQTDSWTMVAQGTADGFGPVGWIQSAHVSLPMEPDLGFGNRLSAMVEDPAPLLFAPFADAQTLHTLDRGDSIVILARYEDYLYVEIEKENLLMRGFVAEAAVE